MRRRAVSSFSKALFPTRFPMSPLARLADISLGRMIQTREQAKTRMVPYIKASNVRQQRVDVDDLDHMWASEADISRLNVKKGDLFVIEGGATAGRVAEVQGDPPPDTIFQNSVHRVRSKSNADPRFLLYSLSLLPVSGWYDAICEVATFKHLTSEKLARVRIPAPALEEQRAIVRFLDEETAKLDSLIAKKHELIELLMERFSAELEQQVFGGQSESIALRRLVDLLPGHAFLSSDMVRESEGNVKLLRDVNVTPRGIRWTDTLCVSREIAAGLERFELAENDIIIGMDRPVIAGGMRVGMVAGSDVPSLLVQRVARIRPRKDAVASYIYYALKSGAFVDYFSPITTGVSVPHISPEQILAFRIPSRGRSEQLRVAREIVAVETWTRRGTALLEQGIRLLRENRHALITAAVTGQIDIRTAA